MKELTNFELLTINGGISRAQQAGRTFGDFLGFCTAMVIYTADKVVEVIKAI